jgi:hypothetical protein
MISEEITFKALVALYNKGLVLFAYLQMRNYVFFDKNKIK